MEDSTLVSLFSITVLPLDKQDSSGQTFWPQSHVLLHTVADTQPLQ